MVSRDPYHSCIVHWQWDKCMIVPRDKELTMTDRSKIDRHITEINRNVNSVYISWDALYFEKEVCLFDAVINLVYYNMLESSRLSMY